jgi:peptidoglycan/LPS O-acetylase OafA/YrhL
MLGVQIFFVLSGFLLALPWMQAAAAAGPRPRLGPFFARRARRILPAYWLHLTLLVAVILPILHGGYQILETDVGRLNLWLHVLLLHFLHPGSASSLGINMALWSLSIEAQFYLLLPLLAPLFVGRRVIIALPGAILLALLWKTYAPDLLMDWIYAAIRPSHLVFFDPLSGRGQAFPPVMMRFFLERQLPGEIAAFALGMAAANLYARFDQATLTMLRLRLLDSAALTILLMMPLLLIQLSPAELYSGLAWRTLGLPVFLLGCALLVLAAAWRAPLVDRLFGGPILMPIGIVSYSLFLWHEPILRLVAAGWLVPTACPGTSCRVALALGLGLMVATLSYLLTERRWSSVHGGDEHQRSAAAP